MTTQQQRLADLEAQVGSLAAEVVELRAEVFTCSTVTEAARQAWTGRRPFTAPARRPDHLHVVGDPR